MQILRDYLHWHYTRGVVDYVRVWGNFAHFFFNFFSIQLLLRTLLNPWKRLGDETEVHITDIEAYFSRAVVNITMRLIGIAVRLMVIVMGMITLVITIIVGSVGFVLWFVTPMGIILLFIAGIKLLFST